MLVHATPAQLRAWCDQGKTVDEIAGLLSRPFAETFRLVSAACEEVPATASVASPPREDADREPDDPSPDEIAAACERIQAGWCDSEREARAQGETRRSSPSMREHPVRDFPSRLSGSWARG